MSEEMFETLWALARKIRSEDWEGTRISFDPFRTEVLWHRLSGYAHFLAQQNPSVSEAERERSRIELHTMRARFLLHRHMIEEMSRLLRDLPVIFWKGISLALQVHKCPELRTLGDIDLIVPPRSVVTALDRLLSSGYELADPKSFPWPPPQWLRDSTHTVEVDEIVLRKNGVLIEIHPQFVSFKLPHSTSLEEMFNRKIDLPLAEFNSIAAFALEETWIGLMVNYHKHLFAGGIGALLDVALLEDRCSPDYEKVKSLIQQWDIDYLVRPSLSHLAALFPDLPSVRRFSPQPAPPDRIRFEQEKGRHQKRTPLYWILQSPHPWRSLWRNLIPSSMQAALRYGEKPKSAKLRMYQWSRPMVLLGRYAKTVVHEFKSNLSRP